jgi:hypothetical protein
MLRTKGFRSGLTAIKLSRLIPYRAAIPRRVSFRTTTCLNGVGEGRRSIGAVPLGATVAGGSVTVGDSQGAREAVGPAGRTPIIGAQEAASNEMESRQSAKRRCRRIARHCTKRPLAL